MWEKPRVFASISRSKYLLSSYLKSVTTRIQSKLQLKLWHIRYQRYYLDITFEKQHYHLNETAADALVINFRRYPTFAYFILEAAAIGSNPFGHANFSKRLVGSHWADLHKKFEKLKGNTVANVK